MSNTAPMGMLSLANLGRHFPPVPPSEQEYYQAIGEFITSYAQAECTVHELARRLTGLKEDKARALFAGLRIGDLKNRTLALLRLGDRSKKVKAEIEACLTQLDLVGKVRDKFVHRSVQYDAGRIKITNEMTAKSMLEYEQDFLKINDLLALHLDCLKISIRLSHITNPSLRRAATKKFIGLLRQPWSYKPQPQQTRKRPSPQQIEIARLLSQPASLAE